MVAPLLSSLELQLASVTVHGPVVHLEGPIPRVCESTLPGAAITGHGRAAEAGGSRGEEGVDVICQGCPAMEASSIGLQLTSHGEEGG